MRNRRVLLLDVGLDTGFNASMQAADALFGSLNAGYEPDPENPGRSGVVDGDFVRSRDQETVFSAMTSACSVLHVMAHGYGEESPSFVSSDRDTVVDLGDLAVWARDYGRGIASAAVIADGCSTTTGLWKKAIRDCLQGPITYIGTSRKVGWYEGTVFAGLFYARLFRNRGRAVEPAKQALDAAKVAAATYKTITGQTCPYRAAPLSPSRAAEAINR